MANPRVPNRLAFVGGMLSLAIAPLASAQQAITPGDPTVREIRAGETVPVARLPDHIYLRSDNDPDSIIWARIPAYRTFLTAAPPVHPSTLLRFEPKKGEYLYFQFARTAERFYVRMRWKDSSEDRQTTVDKFRDGAAIEFALNGFDTSYMMGSGPEKPVNIWYWHPDRDQVEDLIAAGYGTTSNLPEQEVTAQSQYAVRGNDRDNEWHVVMSRKLGVSGNNQVGLHAGTIPVAFAVWQGEEGQRDGNKRVSHNWILVDAEPAAPPPVQAVDSSERSKKAPPPSKIKSKDVPKGGEFY